MIFIETRSLIKTERSKDSGHIKKFYQSKEEDPSFFLKRNDWDEFCDYFITNNPDKLPVLIYYEGDDHE